MQVEFSLALHPKKVEVRKRTFGQLTRLTRQGNDKRPECKAVWALNL